jgi:hypothetical protein
VRRSGVHRSVALALLLKQRGFMDACDATLAPHAIPVFRDFAGSDRAAAAAAAAAMPEIRLVNAFVCKVGGGGGEAVVIVEVADIACKVCDATCGSMSVYEAHVKGKRHAKKMAKFMALHERDENLPDVYFISSDEEAGAARSDDGADIVFVEHMPAAKKRLSSQSEPERARTHPQAEQASAGARVASDPHVNTVNQEQHHAASGHQTYSFTHYRRCSADIAAALKARDAAALLAILICIRNHSQTSPPPIPSHKVRDRMLQLASPTTAPTFLPVEVSPIRHNSQV